VANSFCLDGSALAKRYVPEKDPAQVDTTIDTLPSIRMYFLNVAAGEVLSVLVRKRNAGALLECFRIFYTSHGQE
jgi:hypothetical protein